MTKANKSAKLDLGSLDTIEASDKGADIELLHPTTQEPLGVFFTILGKHSHTFRDHIKETVNGQLRREAAASQRAKMLPPETAENVERRALELLTLCTKGWYSIERDKDGNEISRTDSFTYKGEELTFSVQNALRIYTESLWIREQIDAGIGDLENFIKA